VDVFEQFAPDAATAGAAGGRACGARRRSSRPAPTALRVFARMIGPPSAGGRQGATHDARRAGNRPGKMVAAGLGCLLLVRFPFDDTRRRSRRWNASRAR
jgi:hypothetical protein